MEVKVPGKLILLGEYGILEANHQAIVMAVNRYLKVSIYRSKTYEIHSEVFDIPITFRVNQGRINMDRESKDILFVKEALEIVFKYLFELKISIPVFSLSITSELKDPKLSKSYGLGSSGATVVGIIKSVLEFLTTNSLVNNKEQVNIDIDTIFRLSIIAHYKAQGNGSGVDIAASVYGGVLLYYSMDHQWLSRELSKKEGLIKLVTKSWPCGQVESLKLPENLGIAVGWTGEKASTQDMVDAYLKFRSYQTIDLKHTSYDIQDSFLLKSKQNMTLFLEGIRYQNIQIILKAVKGQRAALLELETSMNVIMETPKLNKLCEIFSEIGEAKLSGAGGGDCGIGFYDIAFKNQLELIIRQWEDAGIEYLD